MISLRDQIRRIYKRIPNIQCQRKCHSFCCRVVLSEAEREYFENATGFGFDGANKERIFLDLLDMANGKLSAECPYLKNRLCSVYKNRPAICRLWGVSEGLPCPHGCKPERILSDKEAHKIIQELDDLKIGQGLTIGGYSEI